MRKFKKNREIRLIVDIDGISTNYIDTSDDKEKTPLVILHGWGSSIDVFSYMIRYLSMHMRVIACDMPGFGKTSEPDAPMNVDDYCDFIEKFMAKLNIKKAHFLGHSFGGRVIIKLLSREKNFDMDRIILVDSAGIKPKRNLQIASKIKIYKLIKKIFSIPIIDKMYPNFVSNMKGKMGSDDYNAASEVMRKTLVRVVEEDLTHLLSHITNQTLLIWGTRDDATPISDAYKMNKLIINSKLVEIQGAGHYSFLDDVQKANSKVLSFLSEDNYR